MENKINSLFVSYEIALQLRERGFEEQVLAFYDEDNKNELNLFGKPRIGMGWNVSAPLFQQVVDWFRIEHDIHIIPVPILTRKYSFQIQRAFRPTIQTEEFEYYEAFTKAIEASLKLI